MTNRYADTVKSRSSYNIRSHNGFGEEKSDPSAMYGYNVYKYLNT